MTRPLSMKPSTFLFPLRKTQFKDSTKQPVMGLRLVPEKVPRQTEPKLDVQALLKSKVSRPPPQGSALPFLNWFHLAITNTAVELSTTATKSQLLLGLFNPLESAEEEKKQRSVTFDLSPFSSFDSSFEEERRLRREQFDDCFDQLIENNRHRLEGLPCLIEKNKTVIDKASEDVRQAMNKQCVSEARYDTALRNRWDHLLLYIHTISTHGDIISKTVVSDITRLCMNSMPNELSIKSIDDETLDTISQEIFNNIPFKAPEELFNYAQQRYFSGDREEVCEEPRDNEQFPTGHITQFWSEFTHFIHDTMGRQAERLIEHQQKLTT